MVANNLLRLVKQYFVYCVTIPISSKVLVQG